MWEELEERTRGLEGRNTYRIWRGERGREERESGRDRVVRYRNKNREIE